MNFLKSVISCFYKYYIFSGRASRGEFWRFYLFAILWGFLIEALCEYQIIDLYFSFFLQGITLVPYFSCGARRLHDVNKSGWLQLFNLTIIGIPVILFLQAMRGNELPNRYGNPSLQG